MRERPRHEITKTHQAFRQGPGIASARARAATTRGLAAVARLLRRGSRRGNGPPPQAVAQSREQHSLPTRVAYRLLVSARASYAQLLAACSPASAIMCQECCTLARTHSARTCTRKAKRNRATNDVEVGTGHTATSSTTSPASSPSLRPPTSSGGLSLLEPPPPLAETSTPASLPASGRCRRRRVSSVPCLPRAPTSLLPPLAASCVDGGGGAAAGVEDACSG